MIVYFSKPGQKWIYPHDIVKLMFFWKKVSFVDEDPQFEDWCDRVAPFADFISRILNFIFPRFNYLKIHKWDTWSADNTLAPIILGLLKQLKETKHGAPNVDDEDVPEELKSTSAPPTANEWDIDDNHFKRWDWVLDEMIWAFTQMTDDESEEQFYDYSEVPESDDIKEIVNKIQFDKDGFNAHNDRINNGLRLMGKYFRALWD